MRISIACIKKRPLGSSARAAARFASSSTTKSSAISIGIWRCSARRKTISTARRKSPKNTALQMVGARIPVPDMRLEYEDAEHLLQRVDLELATREYRPRSLAEKAKAGFAIYGRAEDASRLRRILDERELTQEILTL